MCKDCENLRAELDRLREAFRIDLQNKENLLTAESRKVTKLRNELVAQQEEEAGHDEVKTLLVHWKHVMGKNAKTDIGAGGKRYRVAKRSIERWGFDRCRNAIDGLALIQHVGPHGRKEKAYPGSSVKNDVWHAFGEEHVDEGRFERCLEAYDKSVRPQLAPVSEWQEEQPKPKPTPAVQAARVEAAARSAHDTRDPITRVLEAFPPDNFPQPRGLDRWEVRCPAHDGEHRNCVITRFPGGNVWMTCWSHECPIEEIVAAIGLRMSDLFENAERDENCEWGPRRAGLTRENRDALRVISEYLRGADRELEPVA